MCKLYKHRLPKGTEVIEIKLFKFHHLQANNVACHYINTFYPPKIYFLVFFYVSKYFIIYSHKRKQPQQNSKQSP